MQLLKSNPGKNRQSYQTLDIKVINNYKQKPLRFFSACGWRLEVLSLNDWDRVIAQSNYSAKKQQQQQQPFCIIGGCVITMCVTLTVECTRFLWSVQSRNRCSPVANVIIPLGRRLLAREEGTGMKQTVSGWVLGLDPTHSHILGGHLYDEFGGEVWRWGQSIGQQIALNGMGVKACYAQ